ncbi:hypothetical protein A2686_00915 [Candidatus Woesebacteria bacterium RIFCSPHIGHO2_01_FULL_38_10]|uniref:Uncharacterized protein n=1 Tax=Candidatus Woesebacteria bacterium RIFCSPLOWO2_01_FULL_39_10b TaxID=1802517 RepID=A0A1F8BBE2_9BACT|nr:MAG: hypothetical protein A2686_00915 [Candidatus Woesebacteria bacterium RIFCSPHIGHO2_01_FULL_38_10]OGM60668.1 MAG: hypothetical protein A2892_01310 [Candidatus Woesebacteria bacterium RIFCSPLOWO2_01_FULL_39_10b]
MLFGFFCSSRFPVDAQTVPSFPACSNPQGSLIVSYNNGTHGIVGDTKIYSGSDSVYSVTDTTLIQCFCAEDGSGIQTNWWKISSLSQEEIDTLNNLGWVFVPSGMPWGLVDEPYMAKNSEYACRGGSSTSSSGNSGGQVLALAASNSNVLASTGGSIYLLFVFLAGLIFLGLGIFLRKFKRPVY